jgi:hypothetical protein
VAVKKIKTSYAKRKKKKEAQNGNAQTEEASQKKQTQEEIIPSTRDYTSSILHFNH